MIHEGKPHSLLTSVAALYKLSGNVSVNIHFSSIYYIDLQFYSFNLMAPVLLPSPRLYKLSFMCAKVDGY